MVKAWPTEDILRGQVFRHKAALFLQTNMLVLLVVMVQQVRLRLVIELAPMEEVLVDQ